MRVLVVEDDGDTAALVRAVLRRAGHVVELATSTEDGHWLAVEFDFDVVVLDWELPDGTGVELCTALRAEERWAPILMLTGHAEVGRRVEGLNAGADDYLTKPFAPEELVARVHALGRRVPHERPAVLRHGDLEVDPAARSVRRAGQPVELRPKEFALLELLMRRPGEALSRGEILDRAWDMAYDGMSNVVDVHVRSLRNKVDRPFGRADIETVPRVGYRLRAV